MDTSSSSSICSLFLWASVFSQSAQCHNSNCWYWQNSTTTTSNNECIYKVHHELSSCKLNLFCSLAVLNPSADHTMDVLSPFISVLCHSDWLFHGESWCCPSRPCVVFLTCVHLALFLALSLSPGNSLVSSWCDHSMLISLLWQYLTVLSLLQLC